ncbi:hypothetical protein EON78_06005 [bacterium]|nr:MAG: hypothetical protein EON78_06005 [bacterium]
MKKQGNIYALGRDGCLAEDSANEGLKLWADWVDINKERFINVLNEGERICGEWLALVHGTRYKLSHEPFVVFDLFSADNISLTQENIAKKIKDSKFIMAKTLHKGIPCSVEKAIELLGSGFHGSIDHPEGMIWRLERENKTIFLAKYVFHDKKDGVYLPEISKNKALWNWYPSENNI